MQTWEYCPEYAIRTYAFIIPFLPITLLTNFIHLDKLSVFLILKNIIGLFFAVSARTFLRSIKKSFGSHVDGFTFIFLLTSPGIFFASTAYLPSAICSSFLMFSFAAWLEQNFFTSILFGCVAVLWSGWPFVGVILFPIGLDMLYSTFAMQQPQGKDNKSVTLSDRFIRVFWLIIAGIVIVIVTTGGALAIDSFMYAKL
jgi:alpha-1,2-mannosyltransferase